jgi:hypothetical protein
VSRARAAAGPSRSSIVGINSGAASVNRFASGGAAWPVPMMIASCFCFVMVTHVIFGERRCARNRILHIELARRLGRSIDTMSIN